MSSPPIGPADARESARRRFTLIDVMALVAACAACLVVPRAFRALTSNYDAIGQIIMAQQSLPIFANCWLLVASMTLAALTAFVPHPAGRGRFRRPGALAMLMVALTWASCEWEAVLRQACFVMKGVQFSYTRYNCTFLAVSETSARAALAILAGWTTLILMRGWEPARDWLDRSGLVLGWAWVAWGLLAPLIYVWIF